MLTQKKFYLLVVWSYFIFLTSINKGLEQSTFLLCCCFILYFTYIYNKFIPFTLDIRTAGFILVIPSIVIWYTIFIYNSFLSLKPLNKIIFTAILILYCCALLYIISDKY